VFGELSKPRQIAVIAGVSRYSNLPRELQLPPADYDIESLSRLLIDRLSFDEVIVLKDKDFNRANIEYVFGIYLPGLLTENEKSRVLFAYSGHGADYQDAGYLFYEDTKTAPRKYEDLSSALDMNVLKAMLQPTMHKAQQFLALINACNGGYFLTDAGFSFGSSYFEERGAHAITAGGADDSVHALPNVGSGQGSVFFEMVSAALSATGATVNAKKFEDPAKDGLLNVTQLASFLVDTVQVIENYKIKPRMGSIASTAAGKQGEFFFVTDREKAKAALTSQFPSGAARVFGTVTGGSRFEGGFSPPPADILVQYPDLITSEANLGGGYQISNSAPLDRRTLLRSGDDGRSFYQPRAKVISGRLLILVFQKSERENTILLAEYDPQTGERYIVEQAPYKQGSGYCFDDETNLQIVDDIAYFYVDCSHTPRRYRIGSRQPATESSYSFSARTDGRAYVSPNGRYIAAANSNNWDPKSFETFPEDYKLAVGPGGGKDGEFIGVSLYDKLSRQRQLLFKQSYAGNWSIGKIIWTSDSNKIIFDNSGAVACIWEYDIPNRVLRKLVPEHQALNPFPFEYNDRRYILYTDVVTGLVGESASLLKVARYESSN
jgi:hypothetical protein